ncbi:thioredoxin-disulfide reductase [Candidatus Dependentiae bacterium]|nr:thioredoxin-disulfide reductase [Candidatus Dependentiae bacterium]
MNTNTHPLVIIGGGPAGLTAAIYAARANLKPVVIEGPKPGGQLMGTTAIENWPGSLQITGPELMINMQEHIKKFNVTTLAGSVTQVNLKNRPFSIIVDGKQELLTHSIIIATGATPNRLRCPGEDEFWGKGVSTCAVCDGAFYHNQNIIVVGGGDSGMESASFLARNGNKVTIVHIGDKLTASHAMQQRVINKSGFEFIYNSTVTEIKGEQGKIVGATVTNQRTKEAQFIQADAIFLAIGLKPNTDILGNQLEKTNFGHIKVHDHVKTSIPGVFAAGDVQDPKYRQAIVSSGFGCIAALEAERYLAEHDFE